MGGPGFTSAAIQLVRTGSIRFDIQNCYLLHMHIKIHYFGGASLPADQCTQITSRCARHSGSNNLVVRLLIIERPDRLEIYWCRSFILPSDYVLRHQITISLSTSSTPNSSTTNPARIVKAVVLGAAGEYWARLRLQLIGLKALLANLWLFS